MTYRIPDAVLAQHLAVLGKTGSGKTSTEKLAVEQVVAAGFRVCVLDTIKSDWWGITSSADGKKPGLPFKILGGPHGHVPLHPSAGKALGQIVGSGKLPLSIIDMADFEAGGIQKFFVDFAPALMRSAKGVIYLVIEEAHELAPKERAGFGQENLSIHWAKKLATAGRSKGIRLIVASQRVQSLHNAVLGSCETMITHRLTAPADQEPILKWLKANTDKETQARVYETLSSLPTGTGWICSGEAKIFEQRAFPKFKTYDNAATPESDSDHIEVKTAAVDQDELRSIIGDAVKEAEANDPKALKAKIAELQKQAANIPKNIPDQKALDDAQNHGYGLGYREGEKEGEARGYVEGCKITNTDLALLEPALEQLIPGMRMLQERFEQALRNSGSRMNSPMPAGRKELIPQKQFVSTGLRKEPPQVKPVPKANGTYDLPGPQRKIMESLDYWHAIGHESPSRQQVALVAGYSPTSSSYSNSLSALKTAGHIEYPSQGSLRALISHRDEALSEESAKYRMWQVLTGPQRKIVEAAQKGSSDRETIAERSEYSPDSSSFSNSLSALRTLGLIDYPKQGHVALTDWAAELLS